jgi:biotin carboxyl carrier protein
LNNPFSQIQPGAQRQAPSRRTWVLLAILGVVAVALPFSVWRETWFGRPLEDSELERYFYDTHKPRHIQQALSQAADRILRGDAAILHWYGRIAELGRHPDARIRAMAAWVMGQDNRSDEFHRALRPLLGDPDVMVRRNAALALVRFADTSGREELVAMLAPYRLAAPAAGSVAHLVRPGREVVAGVLLARITAPSGEAVEIRSPFAGRLEAQLAGEGERVEPGDPVVSVMPEAEQVWEALRALYLVGVPEDLPFVERYAAPDSAVPPAVRKQAALTARAIRTRSEQSPTR